MRISDWSSDVCSSDLGNSEIVLDRKVADKRIFPSLDVGKSGTRKEELLVEKDKLSKMWVLRRLLMQMGTIDAMEFLLDKIKDSKTNERSEERRVGNEGVRTCRMRCEPYH